LGGFLFASPITGRRKGRNMTTPANDPLGHLASLSAESTPEPESEAGPSEESTEAGGPSKQLEEALAREAKLQQQLKTTQGRLKAAEKPAISATDLQDIRDELKATQTALFSLVQHSGNEELAEEVSAQQIKSATERAQKTMTQQHQSISEALVRTVHDDDGNLLISQEQVEDIKKLWEAAESDIARLSMVVSDAAKMVIVAERARVAEDAKTAKDEADKQRTQEEEESGVHELDMAAMVSGSDTISGLSPLEKMSKGLQGQQKSSIFT
jgi:hypothetical protein